MRRLFLSLPGLSALLLCGGPGAAQSLPTEGLLGRSGLLGRVPGLIRATTVPTDQIGLKGFTDSVSLRVGGERVTVFASSGGATPNSEAPSPQAAANAGLTLQTVTLWVATPIPTQAQKRALVNVARTYLSRCFAGTTPAQLAALDHLTQIRWQTPRGWNEQKFGTVQLGWAADNGLELQGRARAGLTLVWPTSRCAF